jgi:hypothetical protein
MLHCFGVDYRHLTCQPRPPEPTRNQGSKNSFLQYAWGENIGWIDLGSNASRLVKTTTIDAGADDDGDMLADSWEREQAEAAGLDPVLTHLSATTDTDGDGDGETDLAEYLADSDPFDYGDHASIISIGRDGTTPAIFLQWTSSPRRVYETGSTTTLDGFTVDFAKVAPGSGPTITVIFADPPVERKFWRVGAKLPLFAPAP